MMKSVSNPFNSVMAIVQLDHILRQFSKTAIVGEINFTVPDGQFWVLVGPSGCGKSTILRMIAGLEPITSGNLYIGDRLVNQVPARQRDVAMVFQNYALYPHMTVAENLAFGLKMRGADAQTLQTRVQEVASLLDITHLLDRKPRQLSGGQQQRVALGRAIARQPQVFLLDEPLSNLDAQLRDETRTELKQLHHRVGITTLYVTHDQTEAMTLADQIVVLDRGQIQQIGDPQTLYRLPANRMVATFLGSPAMNILPIVVTDAGLQVITDAVPHQDDPIILCPEAIAPTLQIGQCLDLGVRPEHLQLDPKGSLRAIASVVEPLGREILVKAMIGKRSLLALLPAGQSIQPGMALPLQLNSAHIFLFDPGTGDRFYPAH
ncbi:MAG: ABC transporter ATP-binding protein [Synechococcales bacterium]|nr:ABC transporter ATP-binding protein [Synechococcales bacterium]